MASCWVRYHSDDGNEHETEVEVDAENVFEAAALAINLFRHGGRDVASPSQFTIKVFSPEPTVHLVSFDQVKEFAMTPSGQGEKMIHSKAKVWRLLGLSGEDQPNESSMYQSQGTIQQTESIAIEKTLVGYRVLHLAGAIARIDGSNAELKDEEELKEYLKSKAVPGPNISKALDRISYLQKIVISFTPDDSADADDMSQ